MANEFQQATRDAAQKIVQYIEELASMTVETRYVLIGSDGSGNFDEAKPAARTVIRLDGDSETIVPTHVDENGGRQIDFSIFELHQANVDKAIEYRAGMLKSLLEMLQR